MNDYQFYPTPDNVIATMLAPYVHKYQDKYKCDRESLHVKHPILEPSAGDGAIVDYLTERYLRGGWRSEKIYVAELDATRRYALQGKGYEVIASDWLEYNEPGLFGFIIMNPPFADADSHILKAWDYLMSEGELVALCNRETIDNPSTKERKLLANLISQHGSVEYLGQCFAESDRPTDVEVALVRLTKPKVTGRDWFGDSDINFDEAAQIDDAEFAENPLASRDVVQTLVARYNTVVEALKERARLQKKLDFYLKGIDDAYGNASAEAGKSLKSSVSLQEQVNALKARFWHTIFRKTKMGERCPSSFTKKFDEFSKSQSKMAFTERNIWEVLELFFQNQTEIMQECMLSVFDQVAALHKDNNVHVEGWATNKKTFLNKRIIHPYGIMWDDNKFRLSYGYRDEFYDDIDKVLCWLSGIPVEKGLSTTKAIRAFCDRTYQSKNYRECFESYFFNIRCYKKGTVHLDFKDANLLRRFNGEVGLLRKWIGDGSDYAKSRPKPTPTPAPEDSRAVAVKTIELAYCYVGEVIGLSLADGSRSWAIPTTLASSICDFPEESGAIVVDWQAYQKLAAA